MRGADIGAVEEAAQIVKAKAPTQQITDLEAVLALFSARHHGADLTLDLFRRIGMNTEIIEQSPLFQMLTQKVVDQAKIEGKAEGRVEGKAEGKAEGLKAGAHDAVLAVLTSRFGQLDGDVLNAVDQADEARLNELVKHVGIDSLAQIRHLLDLPE
jgi:predicted transposase YdaD